MKLDNRYRRLDVAEIVQTLTRLRDRIAERFPDASLRRVADELLLFADEATETSRYLRRPNWPIRVAVGAVILAAVAALVLAAQGLHVSRATSGLAELVQGVNAGINNLLLLGAAVFSLLTLEGRLKRRRALASLHQLRSLVHVVDMHQLTKDPERLMSPQPDTASSPERVMSAPELGRYLDYCSELLSLTSKIAAIFAQQLSDPVVLSAVNEIETLASGLSGKIWQKITLLDRARRE